MKKRIKAETGKTYKLKFDRWIPYKRWAGTDTVSQSVKTTIQGEFEFIRKQGSKLYFYEPNKGLDILLSSEEFNNALQE